MIDHEVLMQTPNLNTAIKKVYDKYPKARTVEFLKIYYKEGEGYYFMFWVEESV